MKKRSRGGIERMKERYGYYFVAPWLFGIVVFVLKPLFMSFYYTFTEIQIVEGGILKKFAGLKHIK